MTRYLFVFTSIFISVAFASEAAHASATKKASRSPDQVRTTQAAPAAGGQGTRFGMGVSSINSRTTVHSVSAMFDFGGQHSVQALLSIPSTSPNFDFRIGGIYRNATFGTSSEGFHLGGGFILGTQNTNFLTELAGAVGPHFTVGRSILITADAGPVLSIVNGGASFAVGGLSGLLGLSIHYMF